MATRLAESVLRKAVEEGSINDAEMRTPDGIAAAARVLADPLELKKKGDISIPTYFEVILLSRLPLLALLS